MRIIGGIYKGLKLRVPKIEGVRPTYDKVREALFNILGNRCEGVCFLDLFAGSGAVGLEAISRGAEQVVFVENDKRVVNVLKHNISLFHGVDQSKFRVIHADVKKAIPLLRREQKRFDIIFSDPPYIKQHLNRFVLEECVKQGILNADGIIIIEQTVRTYSPMPSNLFLLLEKNYGETKLIFYGRAKYTKFLSISEKRRGNKR